MPPLYVIQQNARLRMNNRRLQVELPDPGAARQEREDVQVLALVPIGQVSQVVLFGNVGLTTPLIDALLGEGIEVIFLTQDGDFRSLDQPGFSLEMAKGFVRAKLQHQKALLQRHNREGNDPRIAGAVEQLSAALGTLDRRTAVSSLRGVEGSATAAYFSGYRLLLGDEWRFDARLRRPPPDPVNALLSLGYTLLAQLTASAVQAVGLDPYAGYLHEVVYNRPALGLDLVEEFRPVIDGLVLWACHGQLTPADFTPGPAERPVVLSEAGKRRYLQAFEQRLEMRFTHPLAGQKLTLRQCLVEQARQVAARVMENRPGYQGMGFR
jgi:CRISPR-associated protein Cas1